MNTLLIVLIAAILLSVAFAFVAGLFYMYVSRLIFSFRYAPVFRRWGAVWCGSRTTASRWVS